MKLLALLLAAVMTSTLLFYNIPMVALAQEQTPEEIITSVEQKVNDALSGSHSLTPNTALTANVTCNGSPATIIGTNGNDTLVGTVGDDVIAGLGGNDTISGLGGKVDDSIEGGEGDDILIGDGIERFDGNVHFKAGDDVLVGGDGNDTVDCQNGADTAFTGGGTDTLINCELVNPPPAP